MKIDSFLAPGNVFVDFRSPDKVAFLHELAQRAASSIPVSREEIFNALSKREELGSTGIGGGVAIPHARLSGITKPFALAARLKPPVNFDAIDHQPVDLVFSILVPPSPEKDHLNALATISRMLRDRAIVEQLRTSANADAFYRALTIAK